MNLSQTQFTELVRALGTLPASTQTLPAVCGAQASCVTKKFSHLLARRKSRSGALSGAAPPQNLYKRLAFSLYGGEAKCSNGLPAICTVLLARARPLKRSLAFYMDVTMDLISGLSACSMGRRLRG